MQSRIVHITFSPIDEIEDVQGPVGVNCINQTGNTPSHALLMC